MVRAMVVPTGIKGLDELIEGGFPRGSVINITGPTGSGKTILALQFLYKGIIDHDEGGFYISFSERKRLLYRNVASFGWNFSEQEENKKFIFIEFPLQEASSFLSQENTIFNMITNLGIERLVIDPITPLALTYEDEQKRFRGLSSLINMLRGWGCTTLIISEPEEYRPIGLAPLVDGIISLQRKRQDNYRVRTLEVLKMHGVSFESKIVPFKIGKEGITIYPNQYLF